MNAHAVVAVMALLIASFGAQSAESTLSESIDSYRLSHERQIIDELDELTRLRSVAAEPAGVSATADLLVKWLHQRGFEARQLTSSQGTAPLVLGALNVASTLRTVVFYAHYDGQPVTPSQWRADPFVPVMRSSAGASGGDIDWHSAPTPFDPEWRLFGRAVADDKASIVAFLTAFDALRAAGRKPSVNLKVVWEGEEEAGSPHLEQILRANASLFASDLWLIGDAPVHESGKPMLYFGARGIIGLRLKIYGPLKALHDGHYGNWVPNPAAMAAALIAQMRDDSGRILIPGLADQVRPLSADELRAIHALPPLDDQLKREFGMGMTEGNEDLATSLMRPALNVRGLRSGQVGDSAPNAIPIDAEVSIDFRLVPDQSPAAVQAAVERFLRGAGWTIVSSDPDEPTRLAHARLVRVEWEPGYPALRSDMSSPTALAVIGAATRAGRGPVAIMPMMGGSVPIYLFADIFHRPVIGLPIVNHDDNQHAANENLRLGNLWDGTRTYAGMMADLHW